MKYLVIIHIVAGHLLGTASKDTGTNKYEYKIVTTDTLYSNDYRKALIIAQDLNNVEALRLPLGSPPWKEGFTRYIVDVQENSKPH